ncbi:hypothetical protein CC86DRAFT_322170 [Ophiobolus disseminans]|uniref:CCHC-type domain-containing protein n=1 Tax=Ophiobolus disseminans TaxID=1469910 RepID=A0A6A6ZZX8_9PLEO|nr:hypothetical protein CC86DRAFT_322170 [Ophiobolus disseminans]
MSSNTPKTMSSRLMTMKFMQRSASKATASSPSTPNGPPSKKVRLSSGRSAPGTPGTPDHVILQSALEAEEKKRQEALDKAAQHTGETKWVLSFHDPLDGKRQEALQVRQAGFAEIDADGDSSNDEEEAHPSRKTMRKTYGSGVKRKEKPVVFVKTEESEGEVDSHSGESSDDFDSDDPTAALIRETRREVAAEKRKGREPKSQQGRSPNGDMSLHGLSSLSGDRGAPKERNLSNVECFRCGQTGHLQTSCPTPRGGAGRGRGRGRGRR